MTIKTAPEWAYETFGAAALELGLYDGPEVEADPGPGTEGREPGPRPAWQMME